MRLEWDEKKNHANWKKHKVSFELAQRVFEDPLVLSRLDQSESGQERWLTMGMAGSAVLVVAHTYSERSGEEAIRIISARKATRHEQRAYEEG